MGACYHPSILNTEGHFDVAHFRRSFLQSLKENRLNPNAFLIGQNEPTSTTPNPNALLKTARIFAPAVNTAEIDNDCLSDIDDDDDSSSASLLSTAANTPQKLFTTASSRAPRLKLVFDLDNTLLHALSKHKLNGAELQLEDFKDASGRPDLFKFTLPRQRYQSYYIKFRPGVRDFISLMSKYCDLAVHTNATKEYADVVMAIIDPDRTVFGARLAARDDESNQNDRKDMTRLFPGDTSTLCEDLLILDDRRDVWDSVFEKNIIQCNFYEYFESRKGLLTRKYGQTFRDDLNEGNNDDVLDTYCPSESTFDPNDPATSDLGLEDLDRQLPFIGKLIERSAQEYYQLAAAGNKKAISVILQEQRQKILDGVVCLMTGYNKLEQTSSQYGMLDNGPQHRRRLEAMGAKVVDSPSAQVTHVLVMRQTVSTDKARSLCPGSTKFVHNLWIYSCEQTWSRVNETFFDAATLLGKWLKPSTQPIFDHWIHTKHYYESMIAQSDTPSRERKRKLSNLVEPLFKRRCALENDQALESNGLSFRRWSASGAFSEGAEIWSCAEHIVIQYDAFASSLLLRKTALVT